MILHIQPQDLALSASDDMMRAALKGVFILDFERQNTLIPIYRLINRFSGVSDLLNEDGIKSLKRADPYSKFEGSARKIAKKNGFVLDSKNFTFRAY